MFKRALTTYVIRHVLGGDGPAYETAVLSCCIPVSFVWFKVTCLGHFLSGEERKRKRTGIHKEVVLVP